MKSNGTDLIPDYSIFTVYLPVNGHKLERSELLDQIALETEGERGV